MQFREPLTATVIFPFVFRLVNETGVTKGNEDRTGYYAVIILRSFLLPLGLSIHYRRSISSTGVDILSCRDSLRLAMGKNIMQDRPYTSRFDLAIGTHALDAQLWSFAVLPCSRRQQNPCRSVKRQCRRLEVNAERNHRRYQRRTGFRLPAYRSEHRVYYRVCHPPAQIKMFMQN